MNRLTDEEFARVVSKYSNILFKISYSYTKSITDSEDIVQNTFIKLYGTRKIFESDDHLKNWLIRVAINQSLNEIKRKKKEVLINSEYINISDTLGAAEKNEEIRKCVMSLKDNYKNVIILFYYDNCNIREISSILKMSESNVKVTLNRARKKLKEKIIKRGIKYEK